MNFRQTVNRVFDLCIDLSEQGIIINPEIDIKHGEIVLSFYDGYKNRLPFEKTTLNKWVFSENPTETELQDNDLQGNYSSCIQFLTSLNRTNESKENASLNNITNE